MDTTIYLNISPWSIVKFKFRFKYYHHMVSNEIIFAHAPFHAPYQETGGNNWHIQDKLTLDEFNIWSEPQLTYLLPSKYTWLHSIQTCWECKIDLLFGTWQYIQTHPRSCLLLSGSAERADMTTFLLSNCFNWHQHLESITLGVCVSPECTLG